MMGAGPHEHGQSWQNDEDEGRWEDKQNSEEYDLDDEERAFRDWV